MQAGSLEGRRAPSKISFRMLKGKNEDELPVSMHTHVHIRLSSASEKSSNSYRCSSPRPSVFPELPAYLLTHLYSLQNTCLLSIFLTTLLTYFLASLLVHCYHALTCLIAYFLAWLLTYLLARLHICLRTYLRTGLLAHLLTYRID